MDFTCDTADECRWVLSAAGGKPPLVPEGAALRAQTLRVVFIEPAEALEMARVARDVAAANRPWLKEIVLFFEDSHLSDGIYEAVADAAIRSQLRSLQIWDSVLAFAFVPHLARALRQGALQLLWLNRDSLPDNAASFLLDADGEALSDFCAALRGSKLVSLRLESIRLFRAPPASLRAVLQALEGHPTLHVLSISGNKKVNSSYASLQAASKAVAGLIAANSPALRSLSIGECGFDEERLGRIFADALRSNKHLTALSCRQAPRHSPLLAPVGVNACFARSRVLPAVRACPTLQELGWDSAACHGAAGGEHAAQALRAEIGGVLAERRAGGGVNDSGEWPNGGGGGWRRRAARAGGHLPAA